MPPPPHIKTEILESIIGSNLSSAEIRLLLWLLLRSDQRGKVGPRTMGSIATEAEMNINTVAAGIRRLRNTEFLTSEAVGGSNTYQIQPPGHPPRPQGLTRGSRRIIRGVNDW